MDENLLSPESVITSSRCFLTTTEACCFLPGDQMIVRDESEKRFSNWRRSPKDRRVLLNKNRLLPLVVVQNCRPRCAQMQCDQV